MEDYIRQQILDSIAVKNSILSNEDLVGKIKQSAELIVGCYSRGGKVLLAGNGGSAADAQHIAGEFVSRFNFDRPGLPAISLGTDTSVITAIGNDYGFENLFERQIQANAVSGDVFIGITTSGRSKNIAKAVSMCADKHVFSIVLTGANTPDALSQCNIVINAPSVSTPRIQEAHIMIGHIICAIVECTIYAEYNPEK